MYQQSSENQRGAEPGIRAGDIPSLDGTGYDIIFSNYVLHCCKDKDMVFKQVHDSLKRGGMFAFVTWLTHDYCEVAPNMFSSDTTSLQFKKAVRKLYHPPPMEEYRRIIASNRFKIMHLEEKERGWNFGDVNDYVDRLKVNFGEFDEAALKCRYVGNVVVKVPYCTMVLRKVKR